jgi:hypothetical protein
MKHAVEMGPGAVICSYIPGFKKTGSGIQRLAGGEQGDIISLLLFFKVRKVG